VGNVSAGARIAIKEFEFFSKNLVNSALSGGSFKNVCPSSNCLGGSRYVDSTPCHHSAKEVKGSNGGLAGNNGAGKKKPRGRRGGTATETPFEGTS